MAGWQLIHFYSPLLGLLAGVLTGAGLLGMGLLLFRLLRIALPEPWHGTTAYLLGILSASLLFELIAMAHLATPVILTWIWSALVAAGASQFLGWIRRQNIPRSYAVAALLLLHLVVAMAPLSHQDELDYHVLVPARILHDGGLRFYSTPWEAAVWPQLGWHVLQTPLFAFHQPQASAVLAWWTTAVLIWFVWNLVFQAAGRAMASLCCAALLAQGFSIAQFTAMGPHAFGYLATTVAVLAVVLAPEGIIWILPIAATAMVSGKITMAPAAAVLCAAGLRLRGWRAIVSAALFLGPIALWTWVSWKPFDAEALSIYQAMKAFSVTDDNFLPAYEAANWGLLLWLGCGAYFLYAKRNFAWWTAAFLFVMQALLVWFVIAKQLRFLGGIQYGLCVAGAMALGRRYSKWLWAGVVPWACLVVWMSSVFWPVSLGFAPPRVFLERYTGLFQDYEALDRLLPADAVILQGRSQTDLRQIAWLSKPPAFYAPRPMIFDHLYVPNGVPVYMLYVEGSGKFDPWLPDGYEVRERVYENQQARFYPNRTPAGSSDLERIVVYRLGLQVSSRLRLR